jgi:hypothetical protein
MCCKQDIYRELCKLSTWEAAALGSAAGEPAWWPVRAPQTPALTELDGFTGRIGFVAAAPRPVYRPENGQQAGLFHSGGLQADPTAPGTSAYCRIQLRSIHSLEGRSVPCTAAVLAQASSKTLIGPCTSPSTHLEAFFEQLYCCGSNDWSPRHGLLNHSAFWGQTSIAPDPRHVGHGCIHIGPRQSWKGALDRHGGVGSGCQQQQPPFSVAQGVLAWRGVRLCVCRREED